MPEMFEDEFTVIDPDEISDSQSAWGNYFLKITPKQIEDLKAGHILHYCNEYGIFIMLTESEFIPYAKVKDLYNEICKSFPKVTKLSDGRKRTIKARFNDGYTLADFEKLFGLAESSDFLKGKVGSKRGYFHATFDWLIDGNNMVKVIDGNYSNGKSEEHSYDLDKFEQMAYSAKK